MIDTTTENRAWHILNIFLSFLLWTWVQVAGWDCRSLAKWSKGRIHWITHHMPCFHKGHSFWKSKRREEKRQFDNVYQRLGFCSPWTACKIPQIYGMVSLRDTSGLTFVSRHVEWVKFTDGTGKSLIITTIMIIITVFIYWGLAVYHGYKRHFLGFI